MLIDNKTLKELKSNFSLNEYEAKIWTALLSRGVSTAGELSEMGSVPRSRAYDILESLEKKGFVITKVGKPLKFVAVSPNNVLTQIKKDIVKVSQEEVQNVEKVRSTKVWEEINVLHTQGVDAINPLEISLAVKGNRNILNHLADTISSAKESVSISTSSLGLIKKASELKTALEKAKQNGAKIRIAAPITKECADSVAELSKLAEIKDSKEVQARFSIIDGKAITFMLFETGQVHQNYDIGINAMTPYFSQAVEKMFLSQFKGMKTAKSALK